MTAEQFELLLFVLGFIVGVMLMNCFSFWKW